MKGSECKFVKYMEGIGQAVCHSGLPEKLRLENRETASSCMMTS